MSTQVNIIYSIPSPYQESLFECLAGFPDIDLRVFYTEFSDHERDWDHEMGEYLHRPLKKLSFPFGPSVNPGVVRAVTNSDVVVVGGYGRATMQLGHIVAQVSDTPLILMSDTHLDDWNSNPPTTQTALRNVLLPHLVDACDAFFVPGTKQIRYLSHFGADEEEIYTHLYTCDAERFDNELDRGSAKVKEEFGIEDETILLFVGRIVEEKGIEELIRAFSIIENQREDVGLVIAGSGAYESEMNTLIQKLGLDSVYPVGFTPRDDLPDLYGISDVFVFPSRGDPWGVAINEAITSGLPVITTERTGAGRDLVVDGVNGAIVPIQNPGALANGIDSILNSDRLEQMGRQSQLIAQHWTHQLGAKSLSNAIFEVQI